MNSSAKDEQFWESRGPFSAYRPTGNTTRLPGHGRIHPVKDLSRRYSMTVDIETSAVVGVSHPLDTLSREEISRAVAVLKEVPAAAESFRFISVELREPSKEALRNGVQVTREADA